MINLQELNNRYKEDGLGSIKFGGKSYYEINSDKPLSLNCYGGREGFILNKKGEVELFDLSDRVLLKRHYYLTEELNDEDEVEYETEHYWDNMGSNKWWGKTLDSYYPHPWFPVRKIEAFELVNDIPFFRKGKVFKVKDGGVSLSSLVEYSVSNCLSCPEFFKPLYIDEKEKL